MAGRIKKTIELDRAQLANLVAAMRCYDATERSAAGKLAELNVTNVNWELEVKPDKVEIVIYTEETEEEE